MGLIGLGNMGTAMAERVLDAGYGLIVYNRTAEKAEALGLTYEEYTLEILERGRYLQVADAKRIAAIKRKRHWPD